MSVGAAKLTPGFSLVIPAWNDQARVDRTLNRYVPAFEASQKDFEIVVVADGCIDGTRAVVKKMADRGVRLLEFPHRLGKGAAIYEGFDVAQHERLGFADADGPVSAKDILRVVGALDHSECAIASRRIEGASLRVPRPLVRDALSRGWNLLVRGMLFLPFHDTQCGVKFLRRSAYLQVREQAKEFRDWAFDVGLLVLLYRAHRSITEVPVSWSEEEGSRFNVVRDAPRMLRSLIDIRLMSTQVRSSPPSAAGPYIDLLYGVPYREGLSSPTSAPTMMLPPSRPWGNSLTPSLSAQPKWNQENLADPPLNQRHEPD
jgi:glycosyltransferase involved in cell wall biosynthesis